jgi:hypothetical protein
MIGPLLIVFFIARAALGHGREIPCALQTCPVEAIIATAKEDPFPTQTAMPAAKAPDLATLGLAAQLAEAEAPK